MQSERHLRGKLVGWILAGSARALSASPFLAGSKEISARRRKIFPKPFGDTDVYSIGHLALGGVAFIKIFRRCGSVFSILMITFELINNTGEVACWAAFHDCGAIAVGSHVWVRSTPEAWGG